MAVKGAVLGDICGSQFEFSRPKTLQYDTCELFSGACEFTDDTVMTLAVKQAILDGTDLAETMRSIGRHYRSCGYGMRFMKWILSDDMEAYGSYGNGSAMRVSFVGEYYDELNDVVHMAEKTAEVSHNDPEGIKGAVVTAVCIWMAKHGKTKQEIYDYVLEEYPAGKYMYDISMDLDYLAENYKWDETCMGSVPVAMRCFIDSSSFETFMRNLFRLNCDMDTLGAIGGAVAEEFYHGFGFDEDKILRRYLDERMYAILVR